MAAVLIITTAQMVSVSKAKTAVVLEVVEAAALVVEVVAKAALVVKAAVVVVVEVVIVVVAKALMAIALTNTTTKVSSLEMVPIMVLEMAKVKTAKSTTCLITTHTTPITIIGQMNVDMRT